MEMVLMENLPGELLESTLDYCNVEDLVNVACCSSDTHTLLKPLLWRSVRIVLSSLSTEQEPRMENMKYTTHLHIEDDLQHDDEEESGESTANTLSQLISHCNPSKVVFLHTNLNGACLDNVLNILHHVKSLTLVVDDALDTLDNAVNNVVANAVYSAVDNRLLQLEELRVNSPITDHLFRKLLAGEKLRVLEICFRDRFHENILLPFENWTSLEHLKITNLIHRPHLTLNLNPLFTLTSLTYLNLSVTTLREDDLKMLCQCLIRLRTLDLSYSGFTDSGLSFIHCLESLTCLKLENCNRITSRCFSYMKSLPLLHSITFTDDICKVSNGSFLDSGVTELNKLSALKEVHVYTKQFLSGRNSLAVITNSLCHNQMWKVKLETNGSISYHSTFIR